MTGNVPKKNVTHGGKREGAGRPARPQDFGNHTIWFPNWLWDAISPDNTKWHSRNQFLIDIATKEAKRLKIPIPDLKS